MVVGLGGAKPPSTGPVVDWPVLILALGGPPFIIEAPDSWRHFCDLLVSHSVKRCRFLQDFRNTVYRSHTEVPTQENVPES